MKIICHWDSLLKFMNNLNQTKLEIFGSHIPANLKKLFPVYLVCNS